MTKKRNKWKKHMKWLYGFLIFVFFLHIAEALVMYSHLSSHAAEKLPKSLPCNE